MYPNIIKKLIINLTPNARICGWFGAQRNICPTAAPCYILISSMPMDSREFSSISLINSDQDPRSTRLEE